MCRRWSVCGASVVLCVGGVLSLCVLYLCTVCESGIDRGATVKSVHHCACVGGAERAVPVVSYNFDSRTDHIMRAITSEIILYAVTARNGKEGVSFADTIKRMSDFLEFPCHDVAVWSIFRLRMSRLQNVLLGVCMHTRARGDRAHSEKRRLWEPACGSQPGKRSCRRHRVKIKIPGFKTASCSFYSKCCFKLVMIYIF